MIFYELFIRRFTYLIPQFISFYTQSIFDKQED